MVLFSALIIFPITLLGYFASSTMEREVIEFQKKNQQRILISFRDMLVYRQMHDMENTVALLAQDPEILDVFTDVKAARRIIEKWDQVRIFFPERAWIYFGDSQNRLLVSPHWEAPDEYDLRERPWYKNGLKGNGRIVWSPPFLEYVTKDMVLTCSIALFNENQELYGVLAVDTFIDEFLSLFRTGFKEEEDILLLRNQQGKILISNRDEFTQTQWENFALETRNGENILHFETEHYYWTEVPLKNLDWDLISLLPVEEVYRDIRPMRIAVVIIMGLSMILALSLAYSQSSYIVKNIRKLNHYMKDIMNGNYQLSLHIKEDNEFLLMNHQLNAMTEKLSGSIQTVQTLMQLLTHSIRNSLISMDYRLLELIERSGLEKDNRKVLVGLSEDIHSIQRHILNCTLGQQQNFEKYFRQEESSSLEDLFRILQERMKTREEYQKVQILYFNPLTEVEVQGSSILLVHCLENILVNAINVSPQGSDVEVWVKKEGLNIHIDVCDYGPGIASEKKDTLFQLGITDPSGQDQEIHGIGLGVSAKVLKHCGGTIEYLEKQGYGACFRIHLFQVNPQ